jgi:hypothetical protein
MDVQTVVANVLTFNTNTFVRPALQGFSDADLLKRPSEACNPIGWHCQVVAKNYTNVQ